mmetsp:Transcript_23083/g.65033  ORF Transcript_23083/g.65033 Transcript_23083/m.65033 type:complete len:266 (-) Transcript_23083:64-861(-)
MLKVRVTDRDDILPTLSRVTGVKLGHSNFHRPCLRVSQLTAGSFVEVVAWLHQLERVGDRDVLQSILHVRQEALTRDVNPRRPGIRNHDDMAHGLRELEYGHDNVGKHLELTAGLPVQLRLEASETVKVGKVPHAGCRAQSVVPIEDDYGLRGVGKFELAVETSNGIAPEVEGPLDADGLVAALLIASGDAQLRGLLRKLLDEGKGQVRHVVAQLRLLIALVPQPLVADLRPNPRSPDIDLPRLLPERLLPHLLAARFAAAHCAC